MESAAPDESSAVVPAPASRRLRRTWPQRLLLAVNILVILASFSGAAALVVARNISNSIGRVELASPPSSASAVPTVPSTSAAGGPDVTDAGAADNTSAPDETFPPADPRALNFLVTGADNNACIDPNSPYAPAFGDRESMGERSDTIMVMRVDPSTSRAAVLSFPRDLWVDIAGRSSKQRINTAYVRNDPQRLIDTIYLNFGIGIDHYVQVDFCAFKNIVDAVNGVAVPFEYPARDTRSGLDVPVTGCYTFDGDHALAYVRSRYYEYYEDGKWKRDPVSDQARVSRQQDFIRRALSAALDKGITDPRVARGLIEVAQENVVVDAALSIQRMLEFAGVLRDLDPQGVNSYQIEAEGQMIGGNAVLVPRLRGENMQAILAVFRGEAPLAGAPTQVFEVDAPTTTATTVAGTATGSASVTSAPAAPGTTVVVPEENAKGIVPPRDVTC